MNQRDAVIQSLTGCTGCRKPTRPASAMTLPTHELAAIARVTRDHGELLRCIDELAYRAGER